ncbi:MAG: hypothetical protein WAS73_12780 [Defluviicoccus sp.]
MTEKDQGPPTLPLPAWWRLIVAAIAILGFLYFIYRYQEAQDAAGEMSGRSPVAIAAPYWSGQNQGMSRLAASQLMTLSGTPILTKSMNR